MTDHYCFAGTFGGTRRRYVTSPTSGDPAHVAHPRDVERRCAESLREVERDVVGDPRSSTSSRSGSWKLNAVLAALLLNRGESDVTAVCRGLGLPQTSPSAAKLPSNSQI